MATLIEFHIIGQVLLTERGPKGVNEALGVAQKVEDAAARLRKCGLDVDSVLVTATDSDKAPDAPKPPRQKPGRKPRAALGSSPLAQTANGGEPQAGNKLSTTGPDGEDLLATPEFLVRK